MIENYLGFALATMGLAIAPGPDNIFVLSQSVARGTRYGLAIASGLISGCIVHTSLVALGFAAVIKDNEWLLLTIKIAGALYLLYLAIQVFRADAHINVNTSQNNRRSLSQSFLKGLIMNLLNPKVTLFFLALLPQFVVQESRPAWVQIYILGLLFMAVSLIVFYGIAVMAGRLSSYLNTSKSFPIAIKWIQIFVFIGIVVVLFIG